MTDEQTLRMFVSAGLMGFSVCIVLGAAFAVQAALAPDPHPAAAKRAFAVGVQKDLMNRFPTVAHALEAGYFRYTNEDASGSVSYANLQWQSADPQNPSKLRYDRHGNLLGADFSALASPSKTAPSLCCVPYILEGESGGEMYGLVPSREFVAAGGDLASPDPAILVKLGVVSTVSKVKRTFLFPTLWRLTVWVKPNPVGAFAYINSMR